MASNLVIVESPAKKKTVQGYLGEGWQVEASVGHICDLPQREFAIDMDSWEGDFQVSSQKAGVVSKLRKLASEADVVWLATDLDREGEGIAHHLIDELNIPKEKQRRIIFSEITKSAVTAAVKNPKSLDQDRVNAYLARRFLDRMAGYMVSPVLSNACLQQLSAGRVQSLAVRLVVDRENEITNFVSEKYFVPKHYFSHSSGEWCGQLVIDSLVEEGSKHLKDSAVCDRVSDLKDYVVIDSDVSSVSRKPPAPFITSTLQRAASNALGLKVKQSMAAAQMLFDRGLITYPRTDFPSFSDDGILLVRAALEELDFSDHISDPPNKWSAKGGAQEAHEAIRPTKFDGAEINIGSDAAAKAAASLYKLIYNRALACQLNAAAYDQTKLKLSAVSDDEIELTAVGRVLSYPGWLAFMKNDDADKADIEEVKNPVPALSVGDRLASIKFEAETKSTKAPGRYTEPGLVKKLEQLEVGRPSTYASIISTIEGRRYVVMEKKTYVPSDAAFMLVEAMTDCIEFMKYDYTKEVESTLDKISVGDHSHTDLLDTIKSQLLTGIAKLKKFRPAGSVDCPKCGDYPLRRFTPDGRQPFWGCSGHRDTGCNGSMQDLDGKPLDWMANIVPCEKCEEPMRRYTNASGAFWGCSAYQETGCKHSMDDDNGVPVAKVVHNCPKRGCDGHLFQMKKKTGRGKLWGCSNWEAGCSYMCDDKRGKPAPYYSCPNCDSHLRTGESKKGGKNWYCADYKNCNFRCDDKRGMPEHEAASTKEKKGVIT